MQDKQGAPLSKTRVEDACRRVMMATLRMKPLQAYLVSLFSVSGFLLRSPSSNVRARRFRSSHRESRLRPVPSSEGERSLSTSEARSSDIKFLVLFENPLSSFLRATKSAEPTGRHGERACLIADYFTGVACPRSSLEILLKTGHRSYRKCSAYRRRTKRGLVRGRPRRQTPRRSHFAEGEFVDDATTCSRHSLCSRARVTLG